MNAWAVEPGCGLDEAEAATADGGSTATFSAITLSARPRTMTVQVVAGAPHPAGQLYFVPTRGFFRVARVEVWPGAQEPSGMRFLVMLERPTGGPALREGPA